MSIADLSKSIMAIAAVVGLFFSGYKYIDNNYTNTKSFQALEKRVSLNELRRQLRQAEEEAAYYRSLHRRYPNDEQIKEQLDIAEERVKELKEEIKRRLR